MHLPATGVQFALHAVAGVPGSIHQMPLGESGEPTS